MAYLGNSFDGAYDKFPEGPEHYRGESMDATLAEIYRAAVAHASNRIAWYGANAKTKSKVAKGLRIASLILFALGTIAPISVSFLFQINERFGPKPPAEGGLVKLFASWPMAETGYILLACAGALIIFDQFFDSSGSWIRFRQSEARLQVLLAEFRFAWAGLMAGCAGKVTDSTHVVACTTLARDFVTKVEILAEDETSAWAQRFSERLNGFDRNPNLKVSLSTDHPPAPTARNGSMNGAGPVNGTPPVGRDQGDQPRP
jgi:hypothetical protein